MLAQMIPATITLDKLVRKQLGNVVREPPTMRSPRPSLLDAWHAVVVVSFYLSPNLCLTRAVGRRLSSNYKIEQPASTEIVTQTNSA